MEKIYRNKCFTVLFVLLEGSSDTSAFQREENLNHVMRIIVIIKVFEIFGAVFTGDFQQDYSMIIFLTGLDGNA